MNRFRSHTARMMVAVLVMVGFSLYLVQPTQAHQSSQAFTNWLSNMAKTSDGVDLQQELQELRRSTGHLGHTIKEASQIVRRNNEDFSFSFANSAASQHLYQLLLIEWSQFQTENAMASVPTHHVAKPSVPATFEKAAGGLCSFSTSGIGSGSRFWHFFSGIRLQPSVSVVPMASGIAIGAP